MFLIKTVIKIQQESDENFHLCEQFALAKISNHRFLSVNSHEIRRRIDGLVERFTAANYVKFGIRFRELCDALINDPLCNDHYETDIQWSLLQLLFELSSNPVAALTHNKDRIPFHDDDDAIEYDARLQCEHEANMNELISSLIRQNNSDECVESDGSDLSVSQICF